jgi:FKBP-type peptidyl-prolyl cis-trans isomerase (trigger factor)
MADLAKNAEIKGFRKGKAPAKIVEEKVGQQAVYDEALKQLVPVVYAEAVKEQNIKPVVSPQMNAISLEENKDWQIQAITCEYPRVELGDYQGEVKKALATDKIWTPGKDKGKKTPEDKKATEDQKMAKIFEALLKTAKIKIPEILTQQEVDRMLSRLIDQTGRLGLTVEQYLASTGKTSDQIRQEYRQQAEDQLKLELILSAIAEKRKVQVKPEEVEKMIKAVPDEKSRQQMDTPAQRAYVEQLLRKRAVIDFLIKL